MNFQKFYFNEKEVFINLDTEKRGENLGSIDDEDPEFFKIKNRIKNTIYEESVIEAELNNLINDKPSLKPFIKDIKIIFSRYVENPEQFSKFIKAVKEDPFIANEKNFTIAQVYNYYDKKVPKVVNPSLYNKLYNLIPSKSGGGQIGKGELLLSVLTNLKKSKGSGDLEAPNGDKIEVKASSISENRKGGLRFTGKVSFNSVSGKEALSNLSNLIYGDKNKPFIKRSGKESSSVNNEVLKQSFDFYEKNKENKNKIKELLKIFLNYRNVELPSSIPEVNSFEDFKSLVLALQLWAYKENENFNKIMFINNGYFKILDTKNSSFEQIYDFVNKNLETKY